MTRFTFKKEPQAPFMTSVHTLIKLKRKEVGYIFAESEDGPYMFFLAVKREISEEELCPFRWAKLTKRCATEEEAREWLNTYIDQILKKFDLHSFDD